MLELPVQVNASKVGVVVVLSDIVPHDREHVPRAVQGTELSLAARPDTTEKQQAQKKEAHGSGMRSTSTDQRSARGLRKEAAGSNLNVGSTR